MFVKPSRPGLIVRYPDKPGSALPEEGAEVPSSQYWMRRIKCGDVVKAEEQHQDGEVL